MLSFLLTLLQAFHDAYEISSSIWIRHLCWKIVRWVRESLLVQKVTCLFHRRMKKLHSIFRATEENTCSRAILVWKMRERGCKRWLVCALLANGNMIKIRPGKRRTVCSGCAIFIWLACIGHGFSMWLPCVGMQFSCDSYVPACSRNATPMWFSYFCHFLN
jgi:hypothetical protein